MCFHKSPTDGNKDLKILKKQENAFVDFNLQQRRPSFKSMARICHDNRFNYFDPNKINCLAANKPAKRFEFHRQMDRPELFNALCNSPHILTTDDQKAMG